MGRGEAGGLADARGVRLIDPEAAQIRPDPW
jgi:hypothetical protein